MYSFISISIILLLYITVSITITAGIVNSNSDSDWWNPNSIPPSISASGPVTIPLRSIDNTRFGQCDIDSTIRINQDKSIYTKFSIVTLSYPADCDKSINCACPVAYINNTQLCSYGNLPIDKGCIICGPNASANPRYEYCQCADGYERINPNNNNNNRNRNIITNRRRGGGVNGNTRSRYGWGIDPRGLNCNIKL